MLIMRAKLDESAKLKEMLFSLKNDAIVLSILWNLTLILLR